MIKPRTGNPGQFQDFYSWNINTNAIKDQTEYFVYFNSFCLVSVLAKVDQWFAYVQIVQYFILRILLISYL